MTHPIPAAALENHIAILGKTGSGKSNAAKVVVEDLLAQKARVCIVDPTGTWWGLRLAADGRTESPWPIAIFGGERGDLPIDRKHGGAVAEAIAGASTSAIVDTRAMTVGARSEFFTAFAERLLATNQGPLHLVIDEAHLFAPQSGGQKSVAGNEMLHAANNLVSLGRGNGLRIILISQRPAKLHKDSLTQVETLVAMRLIHNLDVKAVKDWIGEWADPGEGKEIIASLPSLSKGDAWIWAPEIGHLERAHFPLVSTFDSGRQRGDRKPPKLKPIDVDAIRARLGEIEADAVANDPRALKARIAELERALKSKDRDAPDPAAIDKAHAAGYIAGREAALDQARGSFLAWVRDREAALKTEMAACATAGDWFDRRELSDDPGAGRPAAGQSRDVPRGAAPLAENSPAEPRADTRIGAERRPLQTLVERYPAGFTEAQWATLTGMKRSGGTWSTYKSRLRTAGLIEESGGLWRATDAAIAAMPQTIQAGDPIGLWKAALGSGPSKILDVFLGEPSRVFTRADIADAVELEASGGTFSTYLSRLKSNGLIEKEGAGFRLAEILMEALS